MEAFAITDRGNTVNEDFVDCGDGFGVLLDGASGLAQECLFADEAPSDAYWLSHVAGAEAARLLQAGATCLDAAHGAYELVSRHYAERLAAARVAPDPLLAPSATIALARVTARTVELLWMGDSSLIVVLRDGIDVLFDPEIRALDAKALGRAQTLRQLPENEGKPARELVRDMLAHHRTLRNQPNGYRIFDPVDGDPARAGMRAFDRADVVAVLGMSDGMMAAFETYRMADVEAFGRNVTRGQAAALIQRMRELEYADRALTAYPRFKVSDDASLFCVPAGGDEAE